MPLANEPFDFSVDADDLAELSHRFVPKEIANDTKKCVKLFQEWTCARNTVSGFERVTAVICLSYDLQHLSKWLCNFVRKQNSEQFSRKTILQYLFSSHSGLYSNGLIPLLCQFYIVPTSKYWGQSHAFVMSLFTDLHGLYYCMSISLALVGLSSVSD